MGSMKTCGLREREAPEGGWTPTPDKSSYTTQHNLNYHYFYDLMPSWVWFGVVHKVCHAPEGGGGLKKCDTLWQGEGGKDHVTSHFQFFHNSQFYFIFYHAYNTNLSCNYHLRSCKKLNLYFRVYYIETPNMVFYCYCLKFSSNGRDYSYLKAVSIFLDICLLTFCSEVWHTLGGGPRFVTEFVTGGGGVKNHQKSVKYFMDGPFMIILIILINIR